MKNKFYITTTIPYVNASPHIGFALELIQTDAIARYHLQKGEEVIFSTGTDEHGVNIYRKATEAGQETQRYVDDNAIKYQKLVRVLNLSSDRFIRTTDPAHKRAAQEFWGRCLKSGDIYKAKYKVKYCAGCELEKTDSELENGKCPLHQTLTVEDREEENYFFKFSKYQKDLLGLYQARPDFVLPKFRFNEIKKFVESGVKDFSVSRLKEKMPWGVSIPGDDSQVMYVWFDALVNYISTLGWPSDEKVFREFWPGSQTAGKDNLRQQSAIWQAMLMSAGLPNSKQIFIHGFITVDGQKMSKTIGNVVDPFNIVEKYGADVVRYFLLREIPSDEDGDFSEERLRERYTSDLANGLGNLVQRVATLIDDKMDGEIIYHEKLLPDIEELNEVEDDTEINQAIENFKLHEALALIWKKIDIANAFVNEEAPWKLVNENPEQFQKVMLALTEMVHHIAWNLQPFLPETAAKIRQVFGDTNGKEIPNEFHFVIQKGAVLFPRLQ